MSTDGLPPDILDFVAAERARPRPSAALEDRVLTRLNASIAALPPVPPSGGSSGSGGAGGTGGGALHAIKAAAGGKAGVALLAFALGTGAGIGLHLNLGGLPVVIPMPVPAPVVLPAAPVVAEPSAPPEVEPPKVDAPAPKVVRAAPPRPPQPAVQGDTLRGERALIEMARTAMARQNMSDAISALEQHQARFLWGQLAEEREALWVRCLAGTGRVAEAKKRAQAFHQLFPDSPLAPLVDSELGALGDGGR